MVPNITILICAAFVAWMGSTIPQPALAAPEAAGMDQPNFKGILRAQGSPLASVASDADALALFTSSLGSSLGLPDSASILTSTSPASQAPPANKAAPARPTSVEAAIIPELTEAAVRLTAELAVWRLALSLEEAANTGDEGSMQATINQSESQRNWLLAKEDRPYLRRTIALAAVLTSPVAARSNQDRPDGDANALSGYVEYATSLDRTYPRLIGPEDSWLSVAEREGPAGIHRRLMEFWEKAPSSAADKERLPWLYFHTRLRPVITAQVVALALRAETEAEHRVGDTWSRLRTWRDRVKELRGFARLCGTWQWTVHNHQNHQDHKMALSFPSHGENAGGPADPRPAKVVVLGDAVYLRWEFPGGYQEDSLLFGGEGQRLEGTFVNSAGAWGSITGKRMTACTREKN
jgi:hypothetical protein